MSRKLNVTQKKLIKAEWMRVWKETRKQVVSYNEIDADTLDKIDALNCNEMFWQNVNRFIDDLNNEVLANSQKSIYS
jgi:hypothetical protein